MPGPKRDILVIVKDQFRSEKAIAHEVECLNEILRRAESDEQFCIAHELVDRNHITSRHPKILKATRHAVLKPFRFLINKN